MDDNLKRVFGNILSEIEGPDFEAIKGRCKPCLLIRLHEAIERAEAAGDYSGAIYGLTWLLERMYPQSFGLRAQARSVPDSD